MQNDLYSNNNTNINPPSHLSMSRPNDSTTLLNTPSQALTANPNQPSAAIPSNFHGTGGSVIHNPSSQRTVTMLTTTTVARPGAAGDADTLVGDHTMLSETASNMLPQVDEDTFVSLGPSGLGTAGPGEPAHGDDI